MKEKTNAFRMVVEEISMRKKDSEITVEIRKGDEETSARDELVS